MKTNYLKGEIKMKTIKTDVLDSIKERMNELEVSANKFLDFRKNNPNDEILLSNLKYMKDMINDLEELISISILINNATELEEMDVNEKYDYMLQEFEDKLDESKNSANYLYAKWLEERSFEEE